MWGRYWVDVGHVRMRFGGRPDYKMRNISLERDSILRRPNCIEQFCIIGKYNDATRFDNIWEIVYIK